jgi:sugar/nucleoside kinase (ribokinase family)
MRPDLLVVGSIAFDSIRTPSGSARRALGGSAVHFSAAARFFTRVKMVGVVGGDFGAANLGLLRRLGIDTGGIETREGKTFHWSGYYEGDMSRAVTLKTELNVFGQFRPRLAEADRGIRHLFLANIHPDLQLAVLSQMRRPRWTAFDTMNYWIDSAKPSVLNVLKRVDISFMNDAEIRQLSGEANLLKAARWVLRRGPSIAIIKKGEHGAIGIWRRRVFLFPAFLLEEVVDPTGAGDSFAGGFLGYLSRVRGRIAERDLKNALVYGAVVASFNVQSFGMTRLAPLSRAEIDRRFRQYREMISL